MDKAQRTKLQLQKQNANITYLGEAIASQYWEVQRGKDKEREEKEHYYFCCSPVENKT